jgi:hypothetical protein
LNESARRVGHYAWLERRLFEVLGRWSTTVPEDEVKVCLAVHSRHHAWHAELWHERLPELQAVERDDLVVPPDDRGASVAEALEKGADEADQTLEKLVGVYRVLLPRLVTTYRADLQSASTITDGPASRVLRLILHDDLDEWEEGEWLIQRLLRDATDAKRAAARAAAVEAAVIAAHWPMAVSSIDSPSPR